MPDADRTNFMIDCAHAITELTLEGDRTGEAGEVLANLLDTHRINVAKAEAGKEHPQMCLCRPKGWARAVA